MSGCTRLGLVVDTETTGLNPAKDQIVELALILFSLESRRGLQPTPIEEYTGMRQPSCPISAGAARVHGLTMRHLAGRQLDAARIRSMVARAGLIVSHNTRFDRPFVLRLFPEFSRKPWYCSMQGVPWHRLGCRSRSLQYLARYYGIDVPRAHRALDDARTTLKLLSLQHDENTTILDLLLSNGSSRGAVQREEVL